MAKFAPHMGGPHGDPQTSPQHADPHGFLVWSSLKSNKSIWIGVLWAGLRVAMWITHVGGKFRHGLQPARKVTKHVPRNFRAFILWVQKNVPPNFPAEKQEKLPDELLQARTLSVVSSYFYLLPRKAKVTWRNVHFMLVLKGVFGGPLKITL